MKWACIVFFIIYFKPDPVYSQIRISPETSIHAISDGLNVFEKISSKSSLFLVQIGIKKRPELKDSLAEYVTFILLWITSLLTILTPLVLIYLWIYYSVQYVKNYRHIFGIKQWILGKSKIKEIHFTNKISRSYRKVYSLMIGFGIAIIAYSIASIRFMLQNFNEMETALIQYFKFPFIALDKFGLIDSKTEIELKFEDFWNQMLLIVVISAIFFLIGYLLGSILVDLRFNFITKQIEKDRKTLKAEKKMFSLETKSEHSISAEAETVIH